MTKGNNKSSIFSGRIDSDLVNWFRIDAITGKVIYVSEKLLDTFRITTLEEFDQLLLANQTTNALLRNLPSKLFKEKSEDYFQISIKKDDLAQQLFSFHAFLSKDEKYIEVIVFPNYNQSSEIILQRDRTAFHILAEAALSSDNLTTLCQKVIEGITKTFDFEIGNITLYNQATELFHVIAFVDATETNEEPQPVSIHDPDYIHAFVARTKEAVFVQDVRKDVDISKFLHKTGPDADFRALITWPLLSSKKQLLGTLQLISLTPKEISEKDRILFKSIAELFALAIEKTLAEIELKRFNEELEQRVIQRTTELETLNKELEAFSYSVSHDLRTPLRHISGFTELIRRNLGENMNANVQHYLDTVVKSTNDMNRLIDDLLFFSRISRAEMKKEKIDITQLVKQIIIELEPEIKNRKIKWTIKKLPYLNGDPPLVRIVLLNLISNAIKFTRVKDVAMIEIGSKKQGKNSEPIIYVKDNGIGFDMKYYNKLFGVFQRLHSDQEIEGTGIGLAMVKRIITRHGGKIWAEGLMNQGAIFYFSLGNIT